MLNEPAAAALNALNEPCGPEAIFRAIDACRAGCLSIRRGEVTFVPVEILGPTAGAAKGTGTSTGIYARGSCRKIMKTESGTEFARCCESTTSCSISIPSKRIASLSSSRGGPTIKVIGGRSLAWGSEPQHVPAELRDARNTHQLHVALDLRPHVAERLLNARLSGCGERVKIHSPA